MAEATGKDVNETRALAQDVARMTGRNMNARRALAEAIGTSTGRDVDRRRAEALAEDDGRRVLSFAALERVPTMQEIDEAVQEAGIPANTAAQVAEQVFDAVKPAPGAAADVTPTPDMVKRAAQATGLPEGSAERIARLVAERQGMLPERLSPQETPRRDLPGGMPEGFDARQEAAQAAVEAARDIRMPAGARERLAQKVEELIEPPDIILDAAAFDARVDETLEKRIRRLPEVRALAPAERDRVIEGVRGIPEDVRRRMEERDAAPRPEAEALPEDFDTRQAAAREQVRVALANVPDLPEGQAERVAEAAARVAALPDLGTMDLAERIQDAPELQGIPRRREGAHVRPRCCEGQRPAGRLR